jgi:hypothetical protein
MKEFTKNFVDVYSPDLDNDCRGGGGHYCGTMVRRCDELNFQRWRESLSTCVTGLTPGKGKWEWRYGAVRGTPNKHSGQLENFLG